MNDPLPAGRLEVRDANGKVVGYIVPAEQLTDMQESLVALRRQVKSLLPAATPEQEAEFRQQLDTGVWVDGEKLLTDLAAELRAGHAAG